ncbi:hypothetical protein Kpho01_34060 [Kitasatospora phosalacinea]|uniref:Uncharacterized protein n=1 Tax=Kitasatospora phosalacinea TaxID=2065 RepID=A0A9W6UQB4_9ACTN|nr:hypothetical protein Kpho01_34060 [Kitasatospora phosalacinea]
MNRCAVRPRPHDPAPPTVRRNPRDPPRNSTEPPPGDGRTGAPREERGQLAVDAEPEELLLELPAEDDADDGAEDAAGAGDAGDAEEDEPLTELLELERLSVR